MAASTNVPCWPPRSPHEALLSSPSGRRKLRNDRTSPSPSPLKKSATTPSLSRIQRRLALDGQAEEEDEEDEETLQLRLDAIEARLKLKKLQQKKAKAASTSSDIENERPHELKYRASSVRKPRQTYPLEESHPKSSSGVQIPVSPARKQQPLEEAKSPGRVLLGIDKGLKGRNVSLKRPPVAQGQQSAEDDPFTSHRSTTSNSRRSLLSSSAAGSYQDPPAKTKSFSERIAETRQLEKEQKDRAIKIRHKRSAGFGVQDREIESFKNAADAQELQNQQRHTTSKDGFSRDEVLKALDKPDGGLGRINNVSTASNERGPRNQRPYPTAPHDDPQTSSGPTKRTEPHGDPSSSQSPDAQADITNYDPFSTLHLSKRILPHAFLTRTFASKPILTLPSLLRLVHSPTYTLPPEYDTDFIVLGAIASKSSPLSHKDAHKSTTSETTSTAEAAESEQNTRGKYMVLTLTDLKWTCDLYLFTTAYTRFWKLTPGTLIAILNPSIMPPPPGKSDTGRFSLTLNSSDDTVLEIGTVRDLGWCSATKRDGKQCGAWVDKRHTSVCEFHVDRVVERTRAGRMEVNGTSAPFGPKGRSGGRTGFWGGSNRRGRGRGEKGRDDGLLKEGRQYDRALGSNYFVAPRVAGFEKSAANLLDAEGVGMGIERGGSKEERKRKRRADLEKERDIARKLGDGGNGMAAEYLRRKHDLQTSKAGGGNQASSDRVEMDARELGLTGNKAQDVHLSPLKKRKAGEAWGTGEEKGRKKTRFVTSKGIKEAGRESVGGDVWLEAGREDSGDELEVV